jgi:hypothetical protein
MSDIRVMVKRTKWKLPLNADKETEQPWWCVIDTVGSSGITWLCMACGTCVGSLREVQEDARLPPGPAEVAVTDDTVTLVLTERIGSLVRADVYYASIHSGTTETPGLVAKVIDINMFAPTYVDFETTQAMAMKFVSDNVLASTELEALQGTVVPRFAGLFARGSVYCMVFEDAGKSLTIKDKISPTTR